MAPGRNRDRLDFARARPKHCAFRRARREGRRGNATGGGTRLQLEGGDTPVAGPGSRPLLCLGLETSCDETAAAVVSREGEVWSNVIASQAGLHARYGGVVPEVAARRHLETALPVVEQALAAARVGWAEIDLVAVTRGPGLPAALLVGLSVAKALAFARDRPLVGVNHLAGHLYAHRLVPRGAPPSQLPRPAVGLVVSGSHTDLCLLPEGGGLRLLGTTLDDAAGEALDKVARLLGLGYPGGPAIERAARDGDPTRLALPRPQGVLAGPRQARAGVVGGSYAFSFSGLKTAVATLLAAQPGLLPADVAAAFQEAVVDTLVRRTLDAASHHGVRTILVAGGVAANSLLRERLAREAGGRGIGLRVPERVFCTDNAAMIAMAGWAAAGRGELAGWDLDADPGLPLAL